jgi:hypothetical protein
VTELRPILGDEPTDDERRLLDSARLDVPPHAGRRRTLAAMALAAAVTTTAGTGGAAATTAGAGLMVKWVALGAIGGTIALGAVGSMTRLVGGPGPRPSAVVAPRPAPAASYAGKPAPAISSLPRAAPETQPARPDDQVRPARAEEQAQRDPTPVHLAPSAATRILVRSAEPTRPDDLPASLAPPLRDPAIVPAADDTLTAEVAALDEARRALAAGDPAPALLALDKYDHRFVQRRLGPEAAVLRIEALLAEGRFGQARQLGNELLAAEPDGAYAQHLRSLLSGAGR